MKNKQPSGNYTESYNERNEYSSSGVGFTLHKADHDLYDEALDKVERVIRVKRIAGPTRGEKWRVFEDTKLILLVDGSKMSKKEREFLRTPNGFSFLVQQGKSGIKSFNKLKLELKKLLAANK